MPGQDDQRRPTAVITVRRECVCVRIYCDISFLHNSQRDVRARDNGQCRADDGYESRWLNLWMIGIRGARGQIWAFCSGPVHDHVSSLTTLLASNRECGTGREMIPNAKRIHSHKARSHCPQLACFYYAHLLYYLLQIDAHVFFACASTRTQLMDILTD